VTLVSLLSLNLLGGLWPLCPFASSLAGVVPSRMRRRDDAAVHSLIRKRRLITGLAAVGLGHPVLGLVTAARVPLFRWNIRSLLPISLDG
jgi:hypothetical protein